jgi:N-acetylmuramoyl-L-alanine amidase
LNDASQIPELSDADIELLCKVTMAESGNQGTQGQELVASVILNRLVSPNYPNTMQGVISQDKQFSSWSDGSVQAAVPTQEVKDSVNAVLESGTITQATYFTRIDANKWHEKDLVRAEDCGWTYKEHCFYNTPAEAEEIEARNEASNDKVAPLDEIEEEYA